MQVKLPDPGANILITNILARNIVEGNKLANCYWIRS